MVDPLTRKVYVQTITALMDPAEDGRSRPKASRTAASKAFTNPYVGEYWVDPDGPPGVREWFRDVLGPPLLFVVLPLIALGLALGPIASFLGFR